MLLKKLIEIIQNKKITKIIIKVIIIISLIWWFINVNKKFKYIGNNKLIYIKNGDTETKVN